MKKLSSKDEDLCSYTGLFGILITLTSLVQHTIISPSDYWQTYTLAGIYLYCIFAYFMLAFKKTISPLLLILACILSLAAVGIQFFSGLFSVIVIIQFVYSLIVTIFIYMSGMPGKLLQIAMAKKTEEEEWMGKI